MDRNFQRFPKTDGPEQKSNYATQMVIHPANGRLGGVSANLATMREGRIQLFDINTPYVVTNHVTETKDNSGTIAAAAGGIVYTTNGTPTDLDDLALNSIRTVAAVAGRTWRFSHRFQVSSAANLGFVMGFLTSGGTVYNTTAPADGFYFHKAKNAATLTFRVVENSNAAVDTTTFVQTLGSAPSALSLVDATDILLEFEIYLGTSSTTRGRLIINGLETNLSSTVATALYNLLNTTAPTLCAHIGFFVNGTTQRTATTQYAWAEVDRS